MPFHSLQVVEFHTNVKPLAIIDPSSHGFDRHNDRGEETDSCFDDRNFEPNRDLQIPVSECVEIGRVRKRQVPLALNRHVCGTRLSCIIYVCANQGKGSH